VCYADYRLLTPGGVHAYARVAIDCDRFASHVERDTAARAGCTRSPGGLTGTVSTGCAVGLVACLVEDHQQELGGRRD